MDNDVSGLLVDELSTRLTLCSVVMWVLVIGLAVIRNSR